MKTKTPPRRPGSNFPIADATPLTKHGLEDSITINLNTPASTRMNTKLEQFPEEVFKNFNIKPVIDGKESYKLICPLIISEPQKTRVFLAQGIESGKDVVVKRFLEFDQGQWRREKNIQNILCDKGEHKNILLAEEFLDEQRIIIYPYLKGGDLRQFQRREGFLNPYQAKGVVNALLSALQVLHQYNITHRDVKPGNIVLDISDLTSEKITVKDIESLKIVPKLFDYETAWHPDLTEDSATIVGTPHYMAPEIIKGKKYEKYDPRIDIYAAGVTLYQLLTGRFPFDAGRNVTDVKEQYLQITEQHAGVPVPDATKINSAIGADLQHILEKALAKDPKKRYQTALEFKKDYFAMLR